MSGTENPSPSRDAVEAVRATTGASMSENVYHQLVTQIAGGAFGSDGKLPSEHDLARTFGVSRPVVREALGRLRKEGLIYSRQGAGSFVATRTIDHATLGFARIETIADIQRCFEFRLTIEPDAAFFAADRRSPQELEAMSVAIGALEEATRKLKHREDVDFVFHHTIARASNNHYFGTALTALQDHIAVGMKLHGLSLMNAGPKLEHVLGEHRAIFEAIRARDCEAARAAMRAHLTSSRDRLFEGRLLDLSIRGAAR